VESDQATVYANSRRKTPMNRSAQLMAMIYVDSVENARAFYVDKLAFTHVMGMLGKDGLLDFCTVSLAGVRVMLMRPTEAMTGTNATNVKRPVEFYMEVADVEAYYDQLKKQNVKPTSPLTEQWWGDRTFTVLDPFGYQIWFFQNVAEPKLPAGAKVV
jgi:PhnB protein